jgi:predicted amidophosphoribosyltransferase
MAKLKINIKNLEIDNPTIDPYLSKPLGIDVGKRVKPTSIICPHCEKKITYLGEPKCKHCGNPI